MGQVNRKEKVRADSKLNKIANGTSNEYNIQRWTKRLRTKKVKIIKRAKIIAYFPECT